MANFLHQVVRHQKKWYARWHTWAGLFCGSILVVVSLTGCLLVFEQELDVWLNPDLFEFEDSKVSVLSFEEVTRSVREQYPEAHFTGIFQDEKRNGVYLLPMKNEEVFEQLYANPYTGNVTGIRVYQESVMGFIRHLHRTLFIPGIGRYLVGISALVCAILMITGLRLWIPNKWQNLRSRLGIKWGASAKRINYDLHNSLGFYFSPAITLIALTGVMITFAQYVLLFMFLLSFESPVSISEILNQKSDYQGQETSISISEAVALTQEIFPEGTVTGLSFPPDSLGAYSMNLTTEAATSTGDRVLVFLDQYSGHLIGSSNDEPYRLAKSYLNWVQPLHYGTFGGLPTRILALVASLITALLFITGFYIWWVRWKKRKGLSDKNRGSINQEKSSYEHSSSV